MAKWHGKSERQHRLVMMLLRAKLKEAGKQFNPKEGRARNAEGGRKNFVLKTYLEKKERQSVGGGFFNFPELGGKKNPAGNEVSTHVAGKIPDKYIKEKNGTKYFVYASEHMPKAKSWPLKNVVKVDIYKSKELIEAAKSVGTIWTRDDNGKAGRVSMSTHTGLKATKTDAFLGGLKVIEHFDKMNSDMHTLSKSSNLQDKQTALVMHLVNDKCVRIGTEGGQVVKGHYGAETLRVGNVKKVADGYRFEFVGKSSKDWDFTVTDPDMVGIIRDLTKGKKADAKLTPDVNYEFMHNKYQSYGGITPKNLRNYQGSMTFTNYALNLEPGKTVKERTKQLKEIYRYTASKLNNEPSVTKAHYVMPRLAEMFIEGRLYVGKKKKTEV